MPQLKDLRNKKYVKMRFYVVMECLHLKDVWIINII